MKKYVLTGLVVIAVFLLLRNLPEKTDTPTKEDKKGTGYVSSMIGIKDQAEKNINEAVQKENEKINEATMENQDSTTDQTKKYSKAIMKTSLGNIEIELFGSLSPKTVANFTKLSSEGFYNGTAFHRVIKDFMIQGGDPLSKESNWSAVGSGGPGYEFADEINSEKLVRGSLAMANSGPNTNGSQFFIVTAESTPWLDGKHTNFGKVVSGMEIVDKIENSRTNQMDQPLEKITINSIELLEK